LNLDPVWAWFADQGQRTEWFAVIGAFLATFLGAGLAARIALRLQSRDFATRWGELTKRLESAKSIAEEQLEASERQV